MRVKPFSLLLVAGVVSLSAQVPNKTLDIYFIDVEGGHAVLYVSPSGQSILVDAGWPGGRDAARIIAAAKQAGIKQIDFLVVTHYHGDHVGGVPELAAQFPIRNFVDHGPTSERGENAQAVYQTYIRVRSKGTHMPVKPGDHIPIAGLIVQVLSAGGGLFTLPVDGGGIPNPLCASFAPMPDEKSDDAHSVGILITYGKFRTINLGDLSWNQEHNLVCPTNRIGTIDLLLTSQHGDDEGSSPTFVHALSPRVAVMNNGARKAVIQPTARTLHASPGIRDVWQLHQSFLGDQQNGPEEFIANLGETDTGHWIKVSAEPDGSFSVTNSRTGLTKSYDAGQ